ncbi:uncharacterized protein LOC108904341 [Anoplophora glabripennis]|uniref:uncharacterized protein LOC108904341 n=1 Tax=Anoplophora glabripennis TaxID=217634 RepID=UPI0008748EF1|nr:uncharacterized protein LOC108904341 [Anoplophora glabripennis]
MMPWRRSTMYGFNNSRISTKTDNPEIVFHNFPKEKHFVCDRMRHYSKTMDLDVVSGQTIGILVPVISIPFILLFVENDYEPDMRNELLGLPPRKLLKTTAVP